MKKLKDFEEDLKKCSKCGLCQTVCPLYKIALNDCVVSKGKFTMLHGVTKGELKLSDNINKYLNMCLKCGKCQEFCPSDIDICQIVNTAKYEYMKDKKRSLLINLLESKLVFNNLLNLGKYFSSFFRPKKKNSSPNAKKVVYFKGCVNQVCPRNDIYLQKIFKNRNLQIIEPDFECCGLPFLSEGNLERFEQVAKDNLELLNIDCDYVVSDCASCENTLRNYSKYVEGFEDICDKLNDETLCSFGELIAESDIKFKFKKPIKVTFHKPCHLKKVDFLPKIFENCDNVKYVEMKDYDTCCGMAGSFALKNRELSVQLSKQKANNIKDTNADYVITACPACLIGLKQGLFLVGDKKTKVMGLLQFLAQADEII